MPSDTFAADPAIVTDAKGNILSTDAKTKDEIAEDSDSFPQGSGQSIAIGKDAYAFMQGGSKAQMMLFGEKKATGSIAIGEGAQALSQAIAIGNRVYTGDLGDVTLSKYNNALSGAGVGSVLLGSNSYTGGTLSTLMGDYSIMSTSYPNGNSAAYTQNAGAVSIGALNSIESATSTNPTSGIADSIVGLANRTQNANGALVYGAGNEITNSIATAAAPSFASSAKKAANDLRESVKNNPGGAALAIGGGNKIDRSIRTQVMGVNNEVTGSLYHEDAQYIDIFGHKFETSPEVNEYSSQYNMVDGYNNKVSNTNNAYVIGTNNTILGKTFSADTKDGTLSKADRTKAKESDNLVIIGDNHTMGKDVKNNIVIGTSDKALTTSVSNAVLLGHNADVQNDGGVAVGDSSVASTDKGAVGYDLKGEDHSIDTTGTWKSTAAAVSVGDTTKNLTRQITGVAAGSSDTDAVNVAQLKKAISSAAGTVKDTRNTVKAGENVTLDTKGNDDSGYEYTVNVKADGKVASGDTKLISGDTVYNETRVQQDGTYVKKDKTAGENLTALDNQVANNTQNITNVNGRVNDLDSKVNKVGAGAAALAALHPLDFDPDDKWDFAVGYGNYRDANSVAVGAFYRPDEDTMFSLGTNFGNGENMINAGVSFKFGQKGKTSNDRLVINKEVTELRATVSRQDEQLKKQDSEIKELKAMVSKLLAAQNNKAEAAK
ncbi:YadA-like family protein [Mitsuokella sp. WILCCON 0060]|uniref:YadA-like family protein n=1 Tax=Mitsuokella sp. WILCCON 0060 TaxID=3345341 RepID=UPI003F1B65F9